MTWSQGPPFASGSACLCCTTIHTELSLWQMPWQTKSLLSFGKFETKQASFLKELKFLFLPQEKQSFPTKNHLSLLCFLSEKQFLCKLIKKETSCTNTQNVKNTSVKMLQNRSRRYSTPPTEHWLTGTAAHCRDSCSCQCSLGLPSSKTQAFPTVPRDDPHKTRVFCWPDKTIRKASLLREMFFFGLKLVK